MEQIECSETSAYKLQTPGYNPKESIQQPLFSFPVFKCLIFSNFRQSCAVQMYHPVWQTGLRCCTGLSICHLTFTARCTARSLTDPTWRRVFCYIGNLTSKELADCIFIDSVLKIEAIFSETSVCNLLDYNDTTRRLWPWCFHRHGNRMSRYGPRLVLDNILSVQVRRL